MNKRIALIPAYEPDEILVELVEKLMASGFQNVVVDDGSGPLYSHIFDSVQQFATVLRHPQNCGKGRALKIGFTYIKEHFGSNCVVVTVDADGQHRVEDANMLCDIAFKHPDTLVIGGRRFTGKIPLRSQIGNTMTRFVYYLSTGLKIYDTQTGLRAFHASMLERLIDIPGEGYEYEMNVLLDFAKNHIPIREEPIETIYIDNNSASHFNVIKDSYRIYKEILKFSASSFIAFLVDYVMYSLFLMMTGNIRTSNICARIFSSCINYNLNRKYVFESDTGFIKSLCSYFLLAAFILIGNTIVLEYLVNNLGVNQMIAKLMTEMAFFIVNWMIQKYVIFRKQEENGKELRNA